MLGRLCCFLDESALQPVTGHQHLVRFEQAASFSSGLSRTLSCAVNGAICGAESPFELPVISQTSTGFEVVGDDQIGQVKRDDYE